MLWEYPSKYNVKLEMFEGPLDLLLYLIKRNKINIYDIPISLITKQYLEYIKIMRVLNLDIAGEFIIMAATLMNIKSVMLLPKREEDKEDEDLEDPRDELVRMLVEHKKYKEAGLKLFKREILNRDTFLRGNLSREREDFIYYEDVSIFHLIEAFKNLMDRVSKKEFYNVEVEEVSIKDKMREIIRILKSSSIISFEELIPYPHSRKELIINFLAILELVKLGIIKIYQILPFERINICLKENKRDMEPNSFIESPA
jgi:segregation and condensation protein A